MYSTNQFRKGLKIEIDGVPYQMVDCQHVSPGKGSGFTRTKLRNLITHSVIEKTFKAGEKVEQADIQKREMQYLYNDAEGYHLMDNESFDQHVLSGELLGYRVGYLQENTVVLVVLFQERPIDVELPNFIEAQIVQTDPGVRGDTVSGGTKPAKIETGATVQVPLHLNEGDRIKVDTRDGSYVERLHK